MGSSSGSWYLLRYGWLSASVTETLFLGSKISILLKRLSAFLLALGNSDDQANGSLFPSSGKIIA